MIQYVTIDVTATSLTEAQLLENDFERFWEIAASVGIPQGEPVLHCERRLRIHLAGGEKFEVIFKTAEMNAADRLLWSGQRRLVNATAA